MSKLTGREVAEANLVDWSLLIDALHTRLITKSFATGLRLVERRARQPRQQTTTRT